MFCEAGSGLSTRLFLESGRVDSYMSQFDFDALPRQTKALIWFARRWPFHRGCTRLQQLVAGSLAGRKPIVAATLAGSHLDILAPWADALGKVVVTFGDNEPDVFRFICLCLTFRQPAQDFFIDVGANLGVFSLRIAERFSGVRVRSYEPHPTVAALLQCNILRNGLGAQIHVRQIALGDRDRPAHLGTTANDSGVSSINDSSSGISISMRRLVTEMSLDEWKRVAVIKIDVEGYELGVLRGGVALFQDYRPPLVFEVNRPALAANGLTPLDLGRFVRELGYSRLFALDKVLYPPENGLYDVCNMVALADGESDLIEKFGFNSSFKPRSRKLWPVVHFEI